jgi:hypothetical protein
VAIALRHFIIISSIVTILAWLPGNEAFGQIKKQPTLSMVRMGNSSDYDVDPKGKYDLIITALNRFLLIDSLIKNQDTVIVCLDRYNISADKIKEVLDPSKLPIKIGAYNIKYLDRKAITKLSEETKNAIRFALIRQIIDYHFAARICLTSKLQLPRKLKNFSDKEYFVLYEYLLKDKEFQFLPEESEDGWELITR